MASFHCRTIGSYKVIALSDGVIEVTPEIAGSSGSEQLRQFLRATGLPEIQLVSVNAFALQTPRGTVLIDTGAGNTMGPTLGHLGESLAAAAINPTDVQTVLLTHIHPDHSNGLIDPAGDASFPKAELLVHENELAHWLDDAKMAQAGPRERRNNFEGGRRAIHPYRDRIRTFDQGEVLPEVYAVPLPGHTPGHTGYAIGSGKDSLLIWGDIVHLPDVQAVRPDITVALDSDRVIARDSRERILARAAAEQFTVAGMHLHFPSFVRVTRSDSNFALLPI